MDKVMPIIFILLLTGCDEKSIGREARVLNDYRCTDKQLDLVDKEFEICTKSSYLDSYCFSSAKKSHCDKIEAPKEESDE